MKITVNKHLETYRDNGSCDSTIIIRGIFRRRDGGVYYRDRRRTIARALKRAGDIWAINYALQPLDWCGLWLWFGIEPADDLEEAEEL